MTKAALWWIDSLPWRWAIGGAVFGLVWIVGGWALVRATPNVLGLVIVTGLFLVPCALLGLPMGLERTSCDA